MDNRLLTPSEAADILKIKAQNLHRLARQGKIEYVMIDGKSRRFTREAIEDFITRRTVPTQIDTSAPNVIKSASKEVESVGELDRRSRLREMRKW